MNSRVRLLTVLDGEIADRVPISTYELSGYNSKSFENNDPSYKRLMDAIREKTDCICMWEPQSNEQVFQSSFENNVEIRQWCEKNEVICEKTIHAPKGRLTQTTKTVDSIHTVWQVEHWCKSLQDVDNALSVPYVPLEYDFSDYGRIAEEVGSNGIIMTSLPDALLLAADLMDFGAFTVWAVTEERHFAKTVRVMHERNMENLRKMLSKKVVDLYRIFGPEYATPPYLPPAFFKKYVVPYVSQMVKLIHSKGGKVRLHCHGKIRKVLEMMKDIGADAIEPCEAPPDGDVELYEVKKTAGDQMCILGNLQPRLLETADAAEIVRQVKDCMNAAKKGGRYIIMPTSAPVNSPLNPKTEANYLRFIDAALEFGKY